MNSYRPALVVSPEGVEQSFVANVVHLEAELVAFGDVLDDDPRGLPYGTPVHSLLIHAGDDGPETIEFNDQSNTVEVDAVASVDLDKEHVRFVFGDDKGPFAGRVSLASEIEVFEDASPDGSFARFDAFDEVRLGALLVRFNSSSAPLESVREKLGALLRRVATVARTSGSEP